MPPTNLGEQPGSGSAPLHKGLILFILGVSQLMIVLDITIVNVAINDIRIDLAVTSQTDLQWIITGYTLAFGGLLLLGGKLADRIGRRNIFMAGAALFSLASLLCAVTDSLSLLVAARALQGAGGAMMAPAALSLLTVVFEEGKERDRAFAVWAAISAGGAAVGLILGGVLVQYLNWRWVFYINVPVGILAILGAYRFVPESRDENARGFDILGAVLVTGGLMALVYALARTDELGWGSAQTLLTIAGAIVVLIAFFIVQRVVRHPLLPLGLFRYRNLTGANLGGFFVASGLFSIFLFIVLWMRQLNGWTPLETGFAMLPVTVFIIVGAGIGTFLVGRIGPRPIVTAGPLIAASGLLLIGLTLEPGSSYAADILPGMLLLATGMGLTFPVMFSAAVGGIPPESTGIASGLLNASQQVGGSVGLALLTAVATERTLNFLVGVPMAPDGTPLNPADFPTVAAGYVEGWSLGLIFAAALLACAAIVMGAIIRGGRTEAAAARAFTA
jgi:EmrB/QacA subfamily drug resistance transporter